jgi:tRNA G18 (ribose-2'-O)-methylase SpoU
MFRKLKNSELGRISVEEYKETDKAPLALVLDNVRSQHNIGSAFRTADAFRLAKICLCGISATPPTPEIHKAALGAEFSVDWAHYDTALEAVAALRKEGYTIVSVEQAEGATQLQDFRPDPDRRYALVFGNEVRGVAQEVVDASDLCLEIPQYGTKHSLNVSVSIGIVLWSIILHNFR